jgi:hypothetical protein
VGFLNFRVRWGGVVSGRNAPGAVPRQSSFSTSSIRGEDPREDLQKNLDLCSRIFLLA